MFDLDDLFIDPLTRRVHHNGKELKLARREPDLLCLLDSHVGQVLTYERLRCHVWGDDIEENEFCQRGPPAAKAIG